MKLSSQQKQLAITVLLVLQFFIPAFRNVEALTVTPLKVELNSDPGRTIRTEIKLYNEKNGTEVYRLTSQGFSTDGESGQPRLITNDNTITQWISLPDSVSVEAKQYKTIPITITIPEGTEPGGYFAAILTSTIPPSSNTDQEVKLESQVGTLILLQINGSFIQGATILDFDTVDHTHWFTSLPIHFYYRFQNESKSWEKPLGDILIKNSFNSTSKILAANPSGGNVLPRSIRRFEATWSHTGKPLQEDVKEPIGPESRSFWDMVKFEWSHFALGRYTAYLNLGYGNTEQQGITTKIHFWIFPWQLLTIILSGLILVLSFATLIAILIIYAIFKKKKKI